MSDPLLVYLSELPTSELFRALRIITDRLESRVSMTPVESAIPLTPEEMNLVRVGQWIGAIKLVRNRLGLGLRDAKNVVDLYRARM